MTVAPVKSCKVNEGTARSRSGADFDRHLQSSKAASNDPSKAPSQETKTVTAQAGDTLSDIARDDGLTTKSLYPTNPQFDPKREDGVLHFERSPHGGWDPDYIRPGDVIRVPTRAPRDPKAPSGRKQDRAPSNGQRALSSPNASGTTPGTAPGPAGLATGPAASSAGSSGNPSSTPVPVPAPTPANNVTPASVTPGPLSGVVPTRFAVGPELASKLSSRPTIGVEGYGKVGWSLDGTPGREIDLNVKVKLTPIGTKTTIEAFAPPGTPASTTRKLSLRERVKSRMALEKVEVNVGLAFKKRVELGGTLEVPREDGKWKWRKRTRSFYISKKDPSNTLVDNVQLKLGKVNHPIKLIKAAAQGTWESVTQPKSTVVADGRWQPLKTRVCDTLSSAEITLSGEGVGPKPLGMPTLGNVAFKATLSEMSKGVQPPASTPGRVIGFTGFAAGTAASFAGAELTDKMIGKHIAHQDLRKAVNGAGAGLAGVATDAVVQKSAPVLASKTAPAVRKVVLAAALSPSAHKVAAVAAKAAPLLSKLAPVVPKAARVLGKVARVGGPAGALLAGVPDGIKAYENFKQGNTTEGWKAVARGSVRVICTGVGAVLGSAGGPLGTVAGAVIGGFAGDLLAKLF